MIEFVCSSCQITLPAKNASYACSCGGLWQYRENSIISAESGNSFPSQRTDRFDLARIDYSLAGLARFAPFLPLPAPALAAASQAEKISKIIQLTDNLLIKDESWLPNSSFKDRGAFLLVAWAKIVGAKKIIQDSSGNAGLSIASYAAKTNIPCEIYLPAGTKPEKIRKIEEQGAQIHLIKGSREHSAAAVKQRLKVQTEDKNKEKLIYASHVYNPLFYLGVRTLVYEIFEELKRFPEHIFIPIGNGSLFLGIVQGLEILLASGLINKLPKITAVQSKKAAPLFNAFQAKAKVIKPLEPKKTAAAGIAIGNPQRAKEILELAAKYAINFSLVTEKEILAARKKLANFNLKAEPTAAVAFAAYLNHCHHFGKTTEILIPLTGNN